MTYMSMVLCGTRSPPQRSTATIKPGFTIVTTPVNAIQLDSTLLLRIFNVLWQFRHERESQRSGIITEPNLKLKARITQIEDGEDPKQESFMLEGTLDGAHISFVFSFPTKVLELSETDFNAQSKKGLLGISPDKLPIKILSKEELAWN